MLRPISRTIAAIENGLLTCLLAALAFVAAGQIALRLGAGSGWAWAAEAKRILVLWLGFIGAAAASREGSHIRIDLAATLLPVPLRLPARRLASLLAGAAASALTVAALRFVADEARYGGTSLFGLPSWLPLSVLPLSFALTAFHFLVRAFGQQSALRQAGPPQPGPPSP